MEDIQNKKPIQPQILNNGQPINSGISAGTKEAPRPVSEFVKPSEQRQNIDTELAQIGVEQSHEAPELDSTHEQVGIMHAPVNTPVITEPTGAVNLPMTDEKAKKVMATYKNKVTYDIGEHGEHDAYIVPSILGLATLTDKVYKFGNFVKGLFKTKERQTT